LLLLLIAGWIFGLDAIDLRGEEPRRALVAWEMLKSGEWWRPTIQGEPYYNKPPVFNWLIAIAYKLFGTESWVVRLPSLMAYGLWGWLNYRVVRHYLDQRTALWSTVFFFTAVHYLFFASVLAGELDLLYGFMVYAQGVVIFHFYQQRRWWPLFIASYLLVSLGFLTKGLPSFAFQAFSLLGLGIWGHRLNGETAVGFQKPARPDLVGRGSKVNSLRRQWGWLFSPAHVLGGLIGLAPIAVYFLLYDNWYGNGWLYFLNLVEEASQKSVAEGSGLAILKHLFEFPFQFLIDHLPWVLLLPYGIWKGWHKAGLKSPFLRFCLLFFAVNIPLYWLSPGARIRYFYGLVPFLFIPLAYWLVHFKPLAIRGAWILAFVLVVARLAYDFTLLPYQQKTTGTIQLYRSITDDAIRLSAGKDLFSCCEADTILVDPSVGGFTLIRDTIIIPMYTPYQIPLYLQRTRDRWLPFRTDLSEPGIYLSTDTLGGILLEQYQVWDDKTLYLFEVPE
jgi:4-amino-4-deoxy-L-arabinose transferase-like glycosyltransferase